MIYQRHTRISKKMEVINVNVSLKLNSNYFPVIHEENKCIMLKMYILNLYMFQIAENIIKTWIHLYKCMNFLTYIWNKNISWTALFFFILRWISICRFKHSKQETNYQYIVMHLYVIIYLNKWIIIIVIIQYIQYI